VSEALAAPLAVAALVLCVAGLAKLRSPAIATATLAALGTSLAGWTVRAFAVVEVGLGAWCLAAPTVTGIAALACMYAGFSALSLLLARRRLSCGCFGDGGAPASIFHALVSLGLAVVAIAAVARPPRPLLAQSLSIASVLAIGTAAAAYAVVLAYTQLPRAWSAWSSR
jgi:hypothetical protein